MSEELIKIVKPVIKDESAEVSSGRFRSVSDGCEIITNENKGKLLHEALIQGEVEEKELLKTILSLPDEPDEEV